MIRILAVKAIQVLKNYLLPLCPGIGGRGLFCDAVDSFFSFDWISS